MFPVRTEHVRRLKFVTKLFPRIKSTLGLDTSKLKSADQYDGELFCGGRSKNRDLLSFFGFITELPGLPTFIQLSNFRRSLNKLINIVETELEAIGAHQVHSPCLIPSKLWEQSNRFERQHDALDGVYNFVDKVGNKLLLGPTYEEPITKMVAKLDPLIEHDLPLLIYQTSPKFRFEPNPRFGLIRSNEFYMTDLYSFDATFSKAEQTYELVSKVYERLFKRLGLDCVCIESVTGNIGGKYSHEYQLPISSGEDTVVNCKNCGYIYNAEMYAEKGVGGSVNECLKCKSTNISESQALELAHTFLLSDIYSKPMKAKFTAEGGSRMNFEMGCYGLGLTRILGAGIDLLSLMPSSGVNEQVQLRWPSDVEPFNIGIVTPAERSKQYNSGSTEFTRNLVEKVLDVTRNVDIIIEDRGKEGVRRRISRLQSLGVPFIVVVGQRFLQDVPEVELLKLDSQKRNYEQYWFNEEQIVDFIRKIDAKL